MALMFLVWGVVLGILIFLVVKFSDAEKQVNQEADAADTEEVASEDKAETDSAEAGTEDAAGESDGSTESVAGAGDEDSGKQSASDTDDEDDPVERVGKFIFLIILILVDLAMPHHFGYHPISDWFRNTFIEKDDSNVSSGKKNTETQAETTQAETTQEDQSEPDSDIGDDVWSEYFDKENPENGADYKFDDLDFRDQVCTVGEDIFPGAKKSKYYSEGTRLVNEVYFFGSSSALLGYARWDSFDNWAYHDTEGPRGYAFFDAKDNLKGYWFICTDDEENCAYWKQWDPEKNKDVSWWTHVEQYEGGHVDEFMFYEVE